MLTGMDKWIGEETEAKEADFRGILNMHVPVCKGILSRTGGGTYLYADLYAGPGTLEFRGRQFPGSPLIAQDVLTRHGVPHEAIHFEKDPEIAGRLAEALWVPVSLLDTPDPASAPIYAETCQQGFPRWLERTGRQPRRLGLVYADPIHDEIPVDLLNYAADYLPRVDLLSYVSATQYKRRRKADLRRNGRSAKPLLSAHVEAVRKGYGLIREPHGRWQHTFILWSNWPELPDWKAHGFYRLDSPKGQDILYTWCDLTNDEQFAKANTPLWSDDVLPAAPARRPAIPRLRRLPAPSTIPGGPRRGIRPRGRDMRTMPPAAAHRAAPPALPAVGRVRRTREPHRRLPPLPLRDSRENRMKDIAIDDALHGEVITARVLRIIALERQAEDAQMEAARLICEELADGKSQRQLAREIGKSQKHVAFMARCWELRDEYYSTHRFSSFSELYNSPEVRGARSDPETELPVPEPESAPGGDAEERGWDELDDGPEPEPERERPKPPPAMLLLRTHDGHEVSYPQPQGKPAFNLTEGEGISWAAWSWNPVTGCLHGCDYCYARAIAHRWPDAYPAGFTPLFHDERLDAPANTVIPAAHRDDPAYHRVFVCSMADLYGRWVPDDWIVQVHAAMLASPQWQYILLTKFPERYRGLTMPAGAWVGTSVDEQKRVRIAERAFRDIDATVKWLSLEPLREPLEFSDLSMFDWVVIGAQTETQQPDGPVPAKKPHWDWVSRITAQAREAGCRVHHKPNLTNGKPGMQMLNEYPS